MRIALISTDYPPLKTSAAVQMRDLAEEFAKLGHQPSVIVPDTGVAAGWSVETLNGVEVLRLAASETRANSHARRAIAEFLLPFSMLKRYGASPIAGTAWDMIIWYSPPIFFAPLIWHLKRQSGGHAYLILRDIFPEWAVDLGLMRRGLVYYAFKAIAAFQYWVADTIGVQTGSNLSYMHSWRKPGLREVEVLSNWLSDDAGLPCRIQIARTILCGRTIFVYIGNMGIAQGMDILIDLAASLQHRPDIGFLFVGRGSEYARLVDDADRRGITNIVFHDEIDSREIPTLLAQCHVGLIALDPRHKSHNIPGKFVSYMRYGLPVLARLNYGTDLAQLIDDHQTGIHYSGDDVAQLAQYALTLADSPELRSKMAVNARALNNEMFLPDAACRQIISACASFNSAQKK